MIQVADQDLAQEVRLIAPRVIFVVLALEQKVVQMLATMFQYALNF